MLNQVVLQGRLTADPQLNQNGQMSTLHFTLASDRSFKNKDGNRYTDFIRCTAFGKSADNMANFFQKGQLVIVYGRWQTGSYQDNSGNRVYTNELVVRDFEFDNNPKQQRNQQQQTYQQPQTQAYKPEPQPQAPSNINLDDLPFD